MAFGRYLRFLRVHLAGYLVALVSVAAVSLCIGVVGPYFEVSNLSMLYLIAVLLAAITHGFGPAAAASFLSVYSYNYFFVAPALNIVLSELSDVVEVALFLLTGFVAGQLAAGQRKRAEEAEKREREATMLYDVMRTVAQAGLERAIQTIAERLRVELHLLAVVITVEDGPQVKAEAAAGGVDQIATARAAIASVNSRNGKGPTPENGPALEPASVAAAPVSGAYPPTVQLLSEEHQIEVVPIAVQSGLIGSLALVRPIDAPFLAAEDDRLLAAVATQVAVLCERERLRHESYETDVLRRTDELKTALLHSVSHELRTPLASIIASSDSLLEQNVEWTELDKIELTHTIRNAAHRLNQIVGNLLDASRIESGTLQPERDWYDLGELLEDVLARLAGVTRQHVVVIEMPDSPLPVYLDYIQISQVVANFVENAAKYSPPSSLITVRATGGADGVSIEVLDQGPGLTDGELPRLFEPFFRSSRTAINAKGVGLGLAIAKGLVEAHDGSIWAANRSEGGARFGFTLPQVVPVIAPAQEDV